MKVSSPPHNHHRWYTDWYFQQTIEHQNSSSSLFVGLYKTQECCLFFARKTGSFQFIEKLESQKHTKLVQKFTKVFEPKAESTQRLHSWHSVYYFTPHLVVWNAIFPPAKWRRGVFLVYTNKAINCVLYLPCKSEKPVRVILMFEGDKSYTIIMFNAWLEHGQLNRLPTIWA